VHSYRRRDIFAYVGLRQYLKNAAAMRDQWSDEIATELLIDRKESVFNEVKSFKEIDTSNEPGFRTLHIPGSTDIMAETALLAACGEAGGVFTRHPSVFSYILATKGDSRGVFEPYFEGFKARHAAIAQACRATPGAVVIYTDIQKFYPSITVSLALRVWRQACKQSDLAVKYVALGEKLLEDARRHQGDADGDASILTGPMISHLIGNLVLRDIDEDLSRECPSSYFRYVDDVAIVATPSRAFELEQRLKANLERWGLHLHDGEKRLVTPSNEWLESENDFDDNLRVLWMKFIADMRRLLLFNPDARDPLKEAFSRSGIRINPPDYSEVAQERGYLERLQSLMKFRWFRRSTRSRAQVDFVAFQSTNLREALFRELMGLLNGFERVQDYERKRQIYRLRFLVSRMLYLGSREQLVSISEAISGIPEMALAASALDAVTTRDVSQILRYGPTAAQAAAHALRANGEIVSCKSLDWTNPRSRHTVISACAVLQLNGLKVESDSPLPDSPALQFSDWTERSFNLFHSNDPYFRELGCVHGIDDPDANRWAIETAFDRDDDLVFDIQETMEAYPY
jgi:hypothetical protein